MAKFLVVVPPFIAHVNPTVSVGMALMRRGHEVAWVSYDTIGKVLPDGARLFALDAASAADRAREYAEKPSRWLTGLKVFWDELLPELARRMVPHVEEAARDFQPDAMFVDQQALAGGIVARRLGIPWATSAATASPVSKDLQNFPKVANEIAQMLAKVEEEHGLKPEPAPDLSKELVILYTTRVLVGSDMEFPDSHLFVGAAMDSRPQPCFDWDRLDTTRPKVFVSLGTINYWQGQGFLRTLMQAISDMDVQAIVSAPAEMLEEWPENAIVESWLPQVPLLARVDAAVTHAGFSTQSEVLGNGVPSVVAPLAYDCYAVAQMVADAGAGIRLRFNRTRADQIKAALEQVLGEPGYRHAAERIRDSYNEAGGSEAAALALEKFAARKGK